MKKLLLLLTLLLFNAQAFADGPFVIAVMDPLAKELACDCIAGFAQRDYKALADHLKQHGGPRFEKVELVFAGTLQSAIQKSSQKRVDMIIGKDSVVRHELQQAKMPAWGIARLTDKQGTTDFTGLVIVANDDPAKTVADLKKHKLLLGPPECDEKHDAAIKLFKKHGVTVPDKPETIDKCTEAGFAIIENESEQPIATVVSDYALALIEGCDLIEKGVLRVIDKTEPVPFITVFVPKSVDEKTIEVLCSTLPARWNMPPNIQHNLSDSPFDTTKLLEALESKNGFAPYRTTKDQARWEFFPVKKEAEGDSKN